MSASALARSGWSSALRVLARGRPILDGRLLSRRRPLLRGRSWRAGLLGAIIAALAAAGGWLWFRDSGFAAVQRVQVQGLSGPGSTVIAAALRRAARSMSTLDYDAGALRRAVRAFPQVRSIAVSGAFPHTLRIVVTEQLPVAVLATDSGTRAAAAADGAVLGAALASSSLPVIPVPSLPRASVRDPSVLAYLAVLGAAPAPLRPFVARVYTSAQGIAVQLKDGMLVYFGDDTRAYAKWISFARALLASGGGAVAYVDVRVPERPAVAPPGTGLAGQSASARGAADAGGAAGEAALVAGLQAAIGGGSTVAQSATTASEGSPSASNGGEPPPGEGTAPASAREAPGGEASAGEAGAGGAATGSGSAAAGQATAGAEGGEAGSGTARGGEGPAPVEPPAHG